MVTDVYDARSDIEKDKVDVEQYVADIHAESVYGGSIEESKQLLEHSILRQGDVLIVMGAGDVTSVAQKLVS